MLVGTVVETKIGKVRITPTSLDHVYVETVDGAVLRGVEYSSASLHVYKRDGEFLTRHKPEVREEIYVGRKEFLKLISQSAVDAFRQALLSAAIEYFANNANQREILEAERNRLDERIQETLAKEVETRKILEECKARLAVLTDSLSGIEKQLSNTNT